MAAVSPSVIGARETEAATAADIDGDLGQRPDLDAAMAVLAGTAASAAATNQAGYVKNAPPWEDEDTEATEDGEEEVPPRCERPCRRPGGGHYRW